MSERLQIHAFREAERDRFLSSLERELKAKGARISWDEHPRLPAIDCRTAHSAGVQSLYLPYLGGFEQEVLLAVGRALDSAWISLFVQEGTIWEYALYRGDLCVDRFSVAPEYWDDSPQFVGQRRGDTGLLSEVWGVPENEVRRYLTNWQMREADDDALAFRLTGKAYSRDRFSYGDVNQVYDFLRALGGADPTNRSAGARQHSLFLPSADT